MHSIHTCITYMMHVGVLQTPHVHTTHKTHTHTHTHNDALGDLSAGAFAEERKEGTTEGRKDGRKEGWKDGRKERKEGKEGRKGRNHL
jgi:hypothetical protein